MDADSGALTRLAARLRAVPALGPAIAAAAAPAVLVAARATAAAGMTPDGKAWAPRKADGGRALADASSALDVRTEGDVIVLELTGVYVYHQATRRILPSSGLAVPPALLDAIRTAARALLERGP